MLICLDLETSGLDPKTSGVWDIGACAIQSGQIISRFSTLVWPGREMLQPHHRASMMRHSNFDAVRLLDADVPDVEAAKSLFLNWILELQPSWLLSTSFNVPFDSGFLNAPPWLLKGALTWGPCVMEAVARRLGSQWDTGEWRISLPKACRRLGVEFTETHRALSDAEAAAKLAILLRIEGVV